MADFRTALEILLRAKDETRAATQSAGNNLRGLSLDITAVSTGFLALRKAAEDAFRIADAVIGSAVREADELDSLAQRTGVAASVLSELKFASDVVGVSFETTASSLETLARKLGDMAIKGGGEAEPALERLGLRLKDIIDLRADEQLQLVLERLGGVENAAERAAIAVALFGRGNTEIVELAGRLDELNAVGRETGAIMSDEFIQKAAEARERFKEFEGAVRGVRNQLVEQILMQIDDEELEAALEAVKELASFAGKVINMVVELTFGDSDQAKLFQRLVLGTGELQTVPMAVKVGVEMREAIEGVAGFIQDVKNKVESLAIFGAQGQPFVVHFKVLDDGSAAQAEEDLKAAQEAARKLAEEEARAAEAAARLRDHVREVLEAEEKTAEATDRHFVAVSSVVGHWAEISRAAALSLKTQEDITSELERMLEVGLTLDEAWLKIEASLGISRDRVLEMVGALEKVEPAITAQAGAFDVFSASAEDALDALAVSIQEQTDSVGATTTQMIGNSLDQMANMWASNIVFGRKWSETIKQIFKQLVADILAELAKLAAKKFFFDVLGGILNLGIPGAGTVLDFNETLARTQQRRGETPLEVPPPEVASPQITFREPEPIVFPPMEFQLPRPDVVAPEVRFIPAAEVSIPPIEAAVPAPIVDSPEVRFLEAASLQVPPVQVDVPRPVIEAPEVRIEGGPPVAFPPIAVEAPTPEILPPIVNVLAGLPGAFPEIDVQAPSVEVLPPVVNVAEPAPVVIPPIDLLLPVPEVIPPIVQVLPPEPVTFPRIDVEVPRPEVIAPEVQFLEPATVTIPPIVVDVPAPTVPEPDVTFSLPPVVSAPPAVIQPPQSIFGLPTEAPATSETRNISFNITVNTGFSSRGVGLATARELIPFLREAGLGGAM